MIQTPSTEEWAAQLKFKSFSLSNSSLDLGGKSTVTLVAFPCCFVHTLFVAFITLCESIYIFLFAQKTVSS